MFNISKAISKLLITAFTFTSVLTYTGTSNAADTKKTTTYLKEQQIIVKYKDQSKMDQVRNDVRKNLKLGKLDLDRRFNKTRIDVLSTGNTNSTDNIIAEFRKSPYVEYAQRNLKLNMLEGDININSDEVLTIGDIVETTGEQENFPGTAINLLKAWELTNGSDNVIVAVIDTGIDISHDELSGSIYVNISEIAGNGIDDDNNGFIDDINGWDFVNEDNTIYDTNDAAHGTMISGLIAAESDGSGIAGVAPGARILPLKFVSESIGYTTDVIAAIEYAEQMGAQIVNCSWGSTVSNDALEDVMNNSDMLFVCSAGNDASPACSYPAGFNLTNVISVGAVNQDGDYAAFSNYGDGVEICAPGVEITSTIPEDKYGTSSGTSMAAPFVTGTAALLLNLYPELDASEIADRIIRNKSSTGNTEGITQKPGMVNAYDTLVDKYPSDSQSELLEDEHEALMEKVAYIIANLDSISDAATDEKEKILDCYHITEASILEGEQLGYTLTDSIEIAKASGKYGFSVSQVSIMIQQTGSMLDACLELNRFQIFLERYLIPESTYDELKRILLEGRETQEIQPAYIMSQALSLNVDDLLRVDGEDALEEILGSLSMQLTDEEIATLEEIFNQYDICKTVLLTYMQYNNITVSGINNSVMLLEEDILEQYNEQTGAIVDLYENEEINKDQKLNSPFSYKAGNSENISMNTGSLQYECTDISIPGRDGLDVNIVSRYDSSDANLYKADYGVSSNINYEYCVYKWKYKYSVSNSGVISDVEILANPVLVGIYSSLATAEPNAAAINGMVISTDLDYVNRTESRTFTATHNNETWHYSGWTNPYKGTLTKNNVAPSNYYINSDGYKGYLNRVSYEKISDTGYIFSDWITTETGNRKKYTRDMVYNSNYKGTLEKSYREVAGVTVTKYCAYIQTYYYRTQHYYNKTTANTYQELHNNMGSGWSLEFSSIEIDGTDKFLHLSDGGVYKINISSTTGDSNLKDYTLSDISLENDSGSYSNGVKSSSYVLIYKNGKKEYFADDGRLLGIRDRFGNTIKFEHTTINSQSVVSNITDTVGRVVSITYSDTTTGKKVVVTAPDSSTVQYILEPIAGYPGEYMLSKKIDRIGRETLFNYQMNTGAFSYLSKSNRNTNNIYADLKGVTYPTGAGSKYSYQKTTGNYGNKGSYDYYRITSREELEDGKSYNKQTYSYTNNYTGYGTCSDPAYLPSSFTYGAEMTDSDNITTSYTFNNKHLMIIEDVKVNGSILVNRTQYTYDTNKLPIIKVSRVYNKNTGKYIENIENYQYDSANFGDIVGYWNPQAQRGTDNTPTDGVEHETIYTYNSTYHYPLSKTYKRDESNTIMEEYTPTSDIKAVEWIRIYENSVLKKQTKYVYDSYGNIIEEWGYLDDMVDYVVNRSSYTDNDTSRNGQLNGTYITRKWAEGVEDVDGSLVEAKSGNSVGVVDEVYRYDIMGNLLEKYDGNGNQYCYEYDDIGRVLKETNPDETYKQWTYNDSSNSLVVTDEISNQMEYDYDGFGNLLYVKDLAVGQILKSYDYDEKFRLKQESNNGGSAITYYLYTNDGRILVRETTDNEGNVLYSETYNYEEAYDDGKYNRTVKTISGEEGSPDSSTVSYTNRLGQVAKDGRVYNNFEYLNTYTYDYLGRKLQEKYARALDESWDTTYTAKYEYDFEGKLLKSYDALGNYTTNTYDSLGRVETVTDMRGRQASTIYSTRYTYDDLGRLIIKETPFDSSDSTITYTVNKNYYDRNNNNIKTMNSNSAPADATNWNTTEYEYNSRNLLVAVEAYDTDTHINYTQYYYDSTGNKVRMYTGLDAALTITGLDSVIPSTDSVYSVTKYKYDRFGQLIGMTDPLEIEETYSYDYNGNMTGKTDRNGNVFEYGMDGLNRILSMSVTAPDGSGGREYTYDYALTGLKLSESDGTNTTSYTYDELGRLTQEMTNTIIKGYTYDAADNRKTFTLTVDGVLKTNTAYNYDYLNRLSTIIENGSTVASYSYDANGNRTSLTYVNGNSESYSYNLANKLTELSNNNGTTLLSKYQYSYNLDGNQSQKLETVTAKSTDYVYDGLGRLLSETNSTSGTQTGSIEYTYDSANNRANMVKMEGGTTTSTGYEYDLNNRLLEETNITGDVTKSTIYYYDKNGNQTCSITTETKPTETSEEESWSIGVLGQSDDSAGVTLNQYDGLNQLIKTISGSTTSEYTYNCGGLRTSKTVNGTTIQHIWDGDQMAMELDGNGAVTEKYVRGINLIYAEDSASTIKYYLYNGHGDVVQLTGTNGAITKTYNYDAFGNEVSLDASDANVFRYCGEYFDKETGTIYLRTRYYDPAIGRFTSEDSYAGKVNDPLSLNLYTYCANNPILYFDPDGHYYLVARRNNPSVVDIKADNMISLLFRTSFGIKVPFGGIGTMGIESICGVVGGNSATDYDAKNFSEDFLGTVFDAFAPQWLSTIYDVGVNGWEEYQDTTVDIVKWDIPKLDNISLNLLSRSNIDTASWRWETDKLDSIMNKSYQFILANNKYFSQEVLYGNTLYQLHTSISNSEDKAAMINKYRNWYESNLVGSYSIPQIEMWANTFQSYFLDNWEESLNNISSGFNTYVNGE